MYWNRKVLREDGTGRLNMILNSDIPRDLRLFILPDLKIVRILSKSQKQLWSRSSAAARTTILRWGKLAEEGVLQWGVSEMNKDGEYKTLIKSKSCDFWGNSVSVFTSLQKAVYGIVVMCVFTILMHAGGVPIEWTGKKLIDQFPRQTPGLTPS